MKEISPLLVIVLLIITILRLVLAIQLTVVARQKDMRNLLWLSVYFYATFFFDIFLNLNATTHTMVNVGGMTLYIFSALYSLAYLVGDIALISFIRLTFYRDRKSPYLFYLGSALAFFIIGLVVAFTTASSVTAPFNPFIWVWLTSAAYQGYRQIADKPVEDWVKARYQLMLAYAIPLLLVALLSIPVAMGAGQIISILGILISIPAFILQYLVWAMPANFRRYLNRNYVAATEEEIMN